MRRRTFLGALGLAAGWASTGAARAAPPNGPVVVSTHPFGRQANLEALRLLAAGGSALDAAVGGVAVVEGDPEVTSVGYGGLPNREGIVQLDAAVMDGDNLDAGAVAALEGVRHPAAVARMVMERTPHVLLVGRGAREFAFAQGVERESLITPEALARWKKLRSRPAEPGESHDTIGTVVRAADGSMAAVCTTSGLADKLPGRVGDSPLVGHGLYCDAAAGGAAATGIGEEVIKVCGSYQVVEFMRAGMAPDDAIRRVLERILRRDPGNATELFGFVAIRADGAVGFGAMAPGFEAAVSAGGTTAVHKAPSLGGRVAP
jgi:isoaspartyl peptidase/L-asparaginase-like protein (Ntn-hydrolase superfamily)